MEMVLWMSKGWKGESSSKTEREASKSQAS